MNVQGAALLEVGIIAEDVNVGFPEWRLLREQVAWPKDTILRPSMLGTTT